MLELGHGFRIVDIHTQLDPDGSYRGRDIQPERLKRELHQAGIVSPGPQSRGYLAANNAVARLSVDRPFVTFARLDGPLNPTSRLRSLAVRQRDYHTDLEDVERFAYDDRFHGFVLNPATDGLPDKQVLGTLADVGLPVIVYGGRGFPPQRVAATLLDYDLSVVLAHFGDYPFNRTLMEQAVDLLADHDQLYLDMAAVRYRDLLEQAIKEHPDGVLFGSGAPAVYPNVAVMELLTCSVPENEMKQVFDDNPSRVVAALAL